MMKNVVIVSLLTLFMQQAILVTSSTTEGATQEKSFYNIPGLNIPIQLKSESNRNILLRSLGTGIPHLALAYMHAQNSQLNLLAKLAQHGLLWSFQNTTGLIGTTFHELGHAVTAKQSKQTIGTPEVTIFYSPTSFLTGVYNGVTTTESRMPPGINSNRYLTAEQAKKLYTDKLPETSKSLIAGPMANVLAKTTLARTAQDSQYKETTKIRQSDFLKKLDTLAKSEESIKLPDQKTVISDALITDKKTFLAWAQERQKEWMHEIRMLLAGPAVGIATQYALVKLLSHIKPEWTQASIGGFRLSTILATSLIAQNLINLLPFNKGCDANQALKVWQQSQEVANIEKQIENLPDNTQITLNWE